MSRAGLEYFQSPKPAPTPLGQDLPGVSWLLFPHTSQTALELPGAWSHRASARSGLWRSPWPSPVACSRGDLKSHALDLDGACRPSGDFERLVLALGSSQINLF